MHYIRIDYFNFSIGEWDINGRNGDLLTLAVSIHERNFNTSRRCLARNVQAIIADSAFVHFQTIELFISTQARLDVFIARIVNPFRCHSGGFGGGCISLRLVTA